MAADPHVIERAQEVERYFHKKADLVQSLYDNRWTQDAAIIATAALDALGAVWFCDFPDEEQALQRELGGGVPDSIRMSRLLSKFSGDPEAIKVAVVFFAEDLLRHAPEFKTAAHLLLRDRVDGREFGAQPSAFMDKPIDGVLEECPELKESRAVLAMIEEYTYPALLYRFVRCPLVHTASGSKRIHGFAVKDEVMYMSLHPGQTSISFGPELIVRWIRATASGYVNACVARNSRPANNVDAGAQVEGMLAGRWKRALGA